MAKTKTAGTTKKTAAPKRAPGVKSASAPAAKRTRKKTVVVTGAAGFVGSHAVEELIAAGMRVIATDYPGSNLAPARKAGAKTMEADITVPAEIDAVFNAQPVDYAVHIAALYDLGASEEKLMRVNRDGSANVFKAALNANVSHAIYFSSGDVYGQPKEMPITEDFPANPINAYAKSKLAGEKAGMELSARRGLPLTIIRPTVIYGPRSRYIASVFFSIPGITRSIGMRLGSERHTLHGFSGGVKVSWVHARDLAGVVRFILNREDTIGNIYNIADDHPLSLEELFKIIFGVFGYSWEGSAPYPRHIIASFARFAMNMPDSFVNRINEFMQSEWDNIQEKYDLSDDLVPRFDRDFFSFMLGDRVYDNSKIKALGYTFQYPEARAGFREAIHWYQQRKWLPHIDTASIF